MATMTDNAVIVQFANACKAQVHVPWTNFSDPSARAQKLYEITCLVLDICRVPRPSLELTGNLGGASGLFDFSHWKLKIDPNGFQQVGVPSKDEFLTLATLIFHEARHCEQWFQMARYAAVGHQMTSAKLAAKLFIPVNIAQLAYANKMGGHYDRNLHDIREQLDLDLAARDQELNEGYLGQKETLIRSKESALESLRQESGANSEAYRQLHNEQEEKKENFRRVELRLNRPLQIHFSKVYLILLFVLAILEVPINKLAVEFFFQESPFLALVLALTIGVVLITLAHFLGLMLRQLGHYRERLGLKGYVAGLFLITLTAGSLIYLISALRQQYVDFIAQEQQQDLAAMLLSDGVGGLLGQTIQTELGVAGLTLLVLNVSVFFLGLMFSFLRHDPHPDYERLYFERNHAINKLVKFRNQFEQNATKLQSEFDEKISYLDKKALALENEIRELTSRRSALETEREHDISMIIDVLRQQILAYQSGNVEGRNGENIPNYFGEQGLAGLKGRITSS